MRLLPGLALCLAILPYLGWNAPDIGRVGAESLSNHEKNGPLVENPAVPHFYTADVPLAGMPKNSEALPTESDGLRNVPEARIPDFDAVSRAVDGYGSPSGTAISKAECAALFERVTARNIGRKLAIVMDNVVLMAPIIHDKSSGGTLMISGNFTIEDAACLCLNSCLASLPQPFTVLESRRIAPAVGKGVGS